MNPLPTDESGKTLSVENPAAVLSSPVESGPRLLFFSGGTALRGFSRQLLSFTHQSIHLITPFDSGGSSAALRRAFAMPAVGDLRSRLMALADLQTAENQALHAVFTYRLPGREEAAKLKEILVSFIDGQHDLMQALSTSQHQFVVTLLQVFASQMPVGFDLRRASIGNLLLTGGYLLNKRDILPVLEQVAALSHCLGRVLPTVDADLHLGVFLQRGDYLGQQHRFTGKSGPVIDSPVVDLVLSQRPDQFEAARVSISPAVEQAISSADLICFPMGSFFSSVLANILPSGVGRAVAANPCAKVYLSNDNSDPEQFGLSLVQRVRWIVRLLRADGGAEIPLSRLLNQVAYPQTLAEEVRDDLGCLREMGIGIKELPIDRHAGENRLQNAATIEYLLELSKF